ncbi:MAG: GNAT family N-acetyltransferase [Clostridia bacterium]|nr:GNAT family N-acetyltransferase [Clostridia bacterium]
MINIENMTENDVNECAALFMERFQEQQEAVPILDTTFITRDHVVEQLRKTLKQNGGKVIRDGRRLLGYMTGFCWDGLLGPNRGVFIPEFGHAVVKEEAFSLYRKLYAASARDWTQNGVLTHAIAFLETEKAGQEAYVWNGFGYQCIDAIRSVKNLELKERHSEGAAFINIKPVTEELIPLWLPMVKEIGLHLVDAPVFKGDIELPTEESLKEELKEDGTLVFMAFLGDEPAGYMKLASVEHGAAWIVNGQKKMCVNGAYVYPKFRNQGLSALLLDEIMNWGIANGFERCSVDFEAMNQQACGFWLKYFKPVCMAMVRRLDSRVLEWRST